MVIGPKISEIKRMVVKFKKPHNSGVNIVNKDESEKHIVKKCQTITNPQ